MSAARAKARKMAARFGRPRRRSAFGPLATSLLLRVGGAAILAASGLNRMAKAAADFEDAYIRVRMTAAGAAPTMAEFAKLRAARAQ